MIHALGVTAATAVIILGTILPFLPGRYDSLAVPVSVMSRVFGYTGLLLVPVGALWVASGHWNRLADKQYGIAIAALVVSSVVWIVLSLVALVTAGLLLCLVAIVFWIYVVARVFPRVKRLRNATPRRTSAVAYYLLIVPVAVVLIQMAVVAPAIESSRNRAIRNSTQLIADIERYREANGRYPASLLAVHEDYWPGVIGIEKYYYEPVADAYNLFFEQSALTFGTREFVIYNPRDQQVMASHKMYLLELTPRQLTPGARLGQYAIHDAPHPHWKYFWFD